MRFFKTVKQRKTGEGERSRQMRDIKNKGKRTIKERQEKKGE